MWGDQLTRLLNHSFHSAVIRTCAENIRSQLRIFRPASLMTMLLLGSFDAAVQAAYLVDWQFDPVAAVLEVTLDEGTTPRYFLLSQPSRIVLDLPDTQLGMVETQQSYSGLIRQIRISQFQEGVTRIVLDVSPEVVLTSEQLQLQSFGNRWVLRPLLDGSQTSAVPQANALPPAIFPTNQRGTVQVPPLNRTNPASIPAQPADTTLPPAIFPTNQRGTVQVPPLNRTNPPDTALPSAIISNNQNSVRVPPLESSAEVAPASVSPPTSESSPKVGRVIEFGEPLSTPIATVPPRQNSLPSLQEEQSTRETENLQAVNPNVILPAGTQLMLRYSGSKMLTLSADNSWQEVLLLEEEIRDPNGRLIAPVGTPVIGRFETDRGGSRFITQAITLRGRNVPIIAASASFDGERQVSENSIVRNSAFGALAGILLSGFSGIGLLGGAAAAAATTYLTAPEPVFLQPNQLIEVQLREDLR